jgi:hypothetical protein
MIAALAACTVALATAGYFASEWRVCNNLEAEAVDAAYSIRGNSKLRFNGAALGLDLPYEDLKRMGQRDEKLMIERLTAVYDRCGMRAGRDANHKLQEVIAGGL